MGKSPSYSYSGKYNMPCSLQIMTWMQLAVVITSYHDGQVKVYLLIAQSDEEETTLVPIVMSSNFPENISLKNLLTSVPDNCKINVPHLRIAPETGVSANVHNYSAVMEEPFENKSHSSRKDLHQFPSKMKHLNDSAVKKNRSYNRSIILKTWRNKALIKDHKVMVHDSEQELKNHNASINSQRSSIKSLAKAAESENDTRDDFEENHINSNVSQGVITKKLHSNRPVKSSNIMAHSSQRKLNNSNNTRNNESNTTKNLADLLVSRNISREEVDSNHDVRDVYYVVHTCSQKQCQIHQVVVLKRGTVQEEDMEAILQTINQSKYSSHNRYFALNEWQDTFSDIISGMLHSRNRNIQWLLPVLLALSLSLLHCVYTYKKKVDVTYSFMEESISDIKELADILKNYTTAQVILERRIVLACNKETDNETQIENMKNEIAHLKLTIQSMHGGNSVYMDDFVTSVLNYLQNCLESGADAATDEAQNWYANVLND